MPGIRTQTLGFLYGRRECTVDLSLIQGPRLFDEPLDDYPLERAEYLFRFDRT
jgi:hypothetical protein